MRFLLAPHTVTSWNLSGRAQGHSDIELAEEGREQAKILAEALEDIAGIVTSDLKRSLQTAEIVNEKFAVELRADPRLRECGFGELEGLTRDEAAGKYGEEILSHWDDRGYRYDFRSYGGEHRDAVASRLMEALEEYARALQGGRILIVSHGRALDTLLVQLGHEPGIERGSFREIEIEGVSCAHAYPLER